MMKGGEIELPAGFRFHPTDEELVNHYLCRKCAGLPIAVPIIAEIDLYKYDPWQLPEMSSLQGEKEWYFFSPRDRKYPNGSRPNRAAGSGYWKATGADKPIGKPKSLGIKKALVFYAGKAPRGIKTNWIMHEYRPTTASASASASSNKNNLRLDDWVLCRIYNKKGRIEKHFPVDRKSNNFPEAEDRKPDIRNSGQNMALLPPNPIVEDDFWNMDTSESAPRLQTDSSSSEHVPSPEVTCDKEVQSEPKWNELEESPGFGGDMIQFNYLDGFENDLLPLKFSIRWTSYRLCKTCSCSYRIHFKIIR